MRTIFKVFTDFVNNIASAVYVQFLLGSEARGTLSPQPGIESTLPALEGKVFTTEPLGKSRGCCYFASSSFTFLNSCLGPSGLVH